MPRVYVFVCVEFLTEPSIQQVHLALFFVQPCRPQQIDGCHFPSWAFLGYFFYPGYASRLCALANRSKNLLVQFATGETYRTKVAGRVHQTPLTDAEKQLLTSISTASEARDWSRVQFLTAKYSGTSSAIYSAAMKGAFRCQKYEEGSSLYNKWLQAGGLDHEPLYVFAIKIFGKLGEAEKVREVYERALKALKLSEILAAARINAAADEGDVEAAAAVLDEMENASLLVNVAHVSSAIRACSGWGKNGHKAAEYLFRLLPRLGLEPNIVLFTCLVRAYHTASLDELILVYREMKDLQVAPNHVFAETYIVSLLQTDAKIGIPRDLDDLCDVLRDKPIERLQAALTRP